MHLWNHEPTESFKIKMRITRPIQSRLFPRPVTSATLVSVQNLAAHHAQLWLKTIQSEQSRGEQGFIALLRYFCTMLAIECIKNRASTEAEQELIRDSVDFER